MQYTRRNEEENHSCSYKIIDLGRILQRSPTRSRHGQHCSQRPFSASKTPRMAEHPDYSVLLLRDFYVDDGGRSNFAGLPAVPKQSTMLFSRIFFSITYRSIPQSHLQYNTRLSCQIDPQQRHGQPSPWSFFIHLQKATNNLHKKKRPAQRSVIFDVRSSVLHLEGWEGQI